MSRLAIWVMAWCALSAHVHAQEGAPPTPTALAEEGDALAAEGKYSGAVARYDAALELDDRCLPALLGRGSAYESMGDDTRALADYDRALVIAPSDVDALLARGQMHSRYGDVREALKDLRRAVVVDPENAYAHGWLGATYADDGRYAMAEPSLERAAALAPEESWILEYYGDVLYSLDKDGKALEVLERAVELDDQLHHARGVLASLQYGNGDERTALRTIDEAIALDNRVGWYHYIRSLILEDLGRPAQAAAAMRRAHRLDPELAQEDGGSYDEQLAEELATVYLTVLGLLVGVLVVLSLIGLALSGSTRARLESVPKRGTPARYDGKASELFVIYLQNVALTLATLGIYRFWAKVRTRQFRYQHTSFAGGRLDYHATGREKFVGFLKGLAVLSPAIAGFYFLYQWLSELHGEDIAYAVCFWGFVLLLFLLRPILLVGSQRFNLSRTSWNHMRFRFTGRVGDAYRIYLKDLVLMVCTFGLYFAWHQRNVRAFRLRHTRMGDTGFEFHGSGGDLFGISVVGTMLSYLTLGLYVPAQIARLQRYHVDNTRLLKRPFRSNITAGMVMTVGAPALLAVILTLGLALPWAVTRWHRLVTDTTYYAGTIDEDQLRAIQDAATSSMVEGIGEAGDALAEIGEMFGG